MVVVSGVAATWCMRALGVSVPAAFVAGTLFALSPYALYKNLGHFGMAIYLVPFVCTVALQLASGRLPERGYLKGTGVGLLIGAGLIGFQLRLLPVLRMLLPRAGDGNRVRELSAAAHPGFWSAGACGRDRAARRSIWRRACIRGAATGSPFCSSIRCRHRRKSMDSRYERS